MHAQTPKTWNPCAMRAMAAAPELQAGRACTGGDRAGADAHRAALERQHGGLQPANRAAGLAAATEMLCGRATAAAQVVASAAKTGFLSRGCVLALHTWCGGKSHEVCCVLRPSQHVSRGQKSNCKRCCICNVETPAMAASICWRLAAVSAGVVGWIHNMRAAKKKVGGLLIASLQVTLQRENYIAG